MRILILGATGMLGYSLFSNLSEYKKFTVYGTVRRFITKNIFFKKYKQNIICDVDAFKFETIASAISQIKPDVVVNCIGLIKQIDASKFHVNAVRINSLLPHEIAKICEDSSSKLIHFSTDCVFDGKKGLYTEEDLPNSTDLYGRSKSLGEVNYGNHLTLRTSIIGHELLSSVSIVDWFLSQAGSVEGFAKAVFSGLPACYIAKILCEKIIPNKDISGLYHLSAEPIDKFSLLNLIAKTYNKNIVIKKSSNLVINRSLDSRRLKNILNFVPPTWSELIEFMHQDWTKRYKK